MIVAGVGFRSGVDAGALAALVAEALTRVGHAGASLSALATLERLSATPAFGQAAHTLGTRALGLPRETLAARDADCPTRSERSLAAHGLGSVAEAAALAAAGPGSRLILARIASETATCALAAPSLPVGRRKPFPFPQGKVAPGESPETDGVVRPAGAKGCRVARREGLVITPLRSCGAKDPIRPVACGAGPPSPQGKERGGAYSASVAPHPTSVGCASEATLPYREGF